MMKKPTLNEEQIRILGIALAIGIMVVAVIVGYSTVSGSVEDASYYDSISETNIQIKETGGMSDGLISFIGPEKISNTADISADINAESIAVIKKFLTYAFPKAKRLSYKNNSATQDGNSYSYEAQLDTGQKLKVTVTDNKNGSFSLAISDKNNDIFNYASRKYGPEYKNIIELSKGYLPKTLRLPSGKQFSITYKDNKYSLNINACGDSTQIAEARAIAEEWLKASGFNPRDIKLDTPKLCDGGYN